MVMPEEWRPEHKLLPHQVGFTCPPFDYDAAPSDFLRMSPESVGVHGWMLQRPLHLAAGLESLLGKPVIGHDIALYWRIYKSLGVAPVTPRPLVSPP